MTPDHRGRTLFVGEALIDVLQTPDSPRLERVGGSVFNVARGVAALDHHASLASWWGRDARGDSIAAAAERAGLTVVAGSNAAPKTSLAYARIDQSGQARYDFEVSFDVPPVADLSPFGHLHTGSFAATLHPGADRVALLASQIRDHATVSYDPNIRPALIGSPAVVAPMVTALVSQSDVVKASDDDLAWLFPGDDPADVLARWAGSGPALVVLTRGSAGATARLASQRDAATVAPILAALIDTVGAGDSFMAGLISGLWDAGLLGSRAAARRLRSADWDAVLPALHRAAQTSSITVAHAGSYAPSRPEILAT